MKNSSILVVEQDDVLAAVKRIFQGAPHPDDPNLLRAIAAMAEGLLRGPLPVIQASGEEDEKKAAGTPAGPGE